MIYRALAELTLATHAVFIAFVVIGGFLAIRVRRVASFRDRALSVSVCPRLGLFGV